MKLEIAYAVGIKDKETKAGWLFLIWNRDE